MNKSLRLYKVIETEEMSAEQLQKILNEAANDLQEKQIDYVVGTKIILGYDSFLNEKGRLESKLANILYSDVANHKGIGAGV